MQKLQTWIELSREAYKNNILFTKKRLKPNVELKLVVKANAYGHGVEQIVKMAMDLGEKSFAVHSIDEAIEVKQYSSSINILIMGPVLKNRLPEIIENGFQTAVFNYGTLKVLNELTKEMQKPVKIHLKIETGTNRLGILKKDLLQFFSTISSNPYLVLDGIYTHFANIEDTTDHSFAYKQLEFFNNICQQTLKAGFNLFKSHSACSAAILLFPETHLDLVRLGISQYGLWSSKETFLSYKIQHANNGEDVLQPVLSWKTRIGQLKKITHGDCIGYGCTYKVTRDSLIAVLPVGYSEGVDRKLSNNGYFLINGSRAPIRGRICMNLTMVDVTDIPDLQEEDEVVLIGRSGDDIIAIEDWAGWIGTINYEMAIKINPGIPRVIV